MCAADWRRPVPIRSRRASSPSSSRQRGPVRRRVALDDEAIGLEHFRRRLGRVAVGDDGHADERGLELDLRRAAVVVDGDERVVIAQVEAEIVVRDRLDEVDAAVQAEPLGGLPQRRVLRAVADQRRVDVGQPVERLEDGGRVLGRDLAAGHDDAGGPVDRVALLRAATAGANDVVDDLDPLRAHALGVGDDEPVDGDDAVGVRESGPLDADRRVHLEARRQSTLASRFWFARMSLSGLMYIETT